MPERRAIEQRVDLRPGILQLMGAFDDHGLQFALLDHGIAPLAGKDSREHARAQQHQSASETRWSPTRAG